MMLFYLFLVWIFQKTVITDISFSSRPLNSRLNWLKYVIILTSFTKNHYTLIYKYLVIIVMSDQRRLKIFWKINKYYLLLPSSGRPASSIEDIQQVVIESLQSPVSTGTASQNLQISYRYFASHDQLKYLEYLFIVSGNYVNIFKLHERVVTITKYAKHFS